MPKDEARSERAIAPRIDYRRLERECREIAEPYIQQMANVYARSLPKMLVKDGEFPVAVYSPEVTQQIDSIKELMTAAIESHKQEALKGDPNVEQSGTE